MIRLITNQNNKYNCYRTAPIRRAQMTRSTMAFAHTVSFKHILEHIIGLPTCHKIPYCSSHLGQHPLPNIVRARAPIARNTAWHIPQRRARRANTSTQARASYLAVHTTLMQARAESFACAQRRPPRAEGARTPDSSRTTGTHPPTPRAWLAYTPNSTRTYVRAHSVHPSSMRAHILLRGAHRPRDVIPLTHPRARRCLRRIFDHLTCGSTYCNTSCSPPLCMREWRTSPHYQTSPPSRCAVGQHHAHALLPAGARRSHSGALLPECAAQSHARIPCPKVASPP